MVAAGKLSSMVLWGLPGPADDLAGLLADAVGMRFVAISNVLGIADLKKIFAEAGRWPKPASHFAVRREVNRSIARSRRFCPMRGRHRELAGQPPNPSFELNAALRHAQGVLRAGRTSGLERCRASEADADDRCGTDEARAALIASADGDGRFC